MNVYLMNSAEHSQWYTFDPKVAKAIRIVLFDRLEEYTILKDNNGVEVCIVPVKDRYLESVCPLCQAETIFARYDDVFQCSSCGYYTS